MNLIQLICLVGVLMLFTPIGTCGYFNAFNLFNWNWNRWFNNWAQNSTLNSTLFNQSSSIDRPSPKLLPRKEKKSYEENAMPQSKDLEVSIYETITKIKENRQQKEEMIESMKKVDVDDSAEMQTTTMFPSITTNEFMNDIVTTYHRTLNSDFSNREPSIIDFIVKTETVTTTPLEADEINFLVATTTTSATPLTITKSPEVSNSIQLGIEKEEGQEESLIEAINHSNVVESKVQSQEIPTITTTTTATPVSIVLGTTTTVAPFEDSQKQSNFPKKETLEKASIESFYVLLPTTTTDPLSTTSSSPSSSSSSSSTNSLNNEIELNQQQESLATTTMSVVEEVGSITTVPPKVERKMTKSSRKLTSKETPSDVDVFASADRGSNQLFMQELLNLRQRNEGNIVRHDEPWPASVLSTTVLPAVSMTTVKNLIAFNRRYKVAKGKKITLNFDQTTQPSPPTTSTERYQDNNLETMTTASEKKDEPTFFIIFPVKTEKSLCEPMTTTTTIADTTATVIPTTPPTTIKRKSNKKLDIDNIDTHFDYNNHLMVDKAPMIGVGSFDVDFLNSFQKYYTNAAIFDEQMKQYPANTAKVVPVEDPVDSKAFEGENELNPAKLLDTSGDNLPLTIV